MQAGTWHSAIFFAQYWLISKKLICFAVNNKPHGLLFVKKTLTHTNEKIDLPGIGIGICTFGTIMHGRV
jgi:hypothetical protein